MIKYIKIEDLVNFGVYKINGRINKIGIWSANKRGFYIVDSKGDVHIKYHYDIGKPYGTAKPINIISSDLTPVDFEDHFKIKEIIRGFYD